jgi:hypothetical protein
MVKVNRLGLLLCTLSIILILSASGIAQALDTVTITNTASTNYSIDRMGLAWGTHSVGQVFTPSTTAQVVEVQAHLDASEYGETVYMTSSLWTVDQATNVPTSKIAESNTVALDLYDSTQGIESWTQFSYRMEMPTVYAGNKYAFLITYTSDFYQTSTAEILFGVNHSDTYSDGCALYGYTDGSVGYQPNLNQDLNFRVVQDITASPASGHEVLSVTVPSQASIVGNQIDASVEKSVKSLDVDVTVSPQATWKLCKDDACKKELSDQVLKLHTGSNLAYILVTGSDGQSKLYTLTIFKR